MADHVEQRLVAPDIALQRRDVEVADDQGRLGKPFRPARHALDEIQLLPELRIDLAIGNIAAGGHIDILDPDPAVEPDADMARLAIVLPVVAALVVQAAADRMATPWCIRWPLSLRCDVAEASEQLGREDLVVGLGLLKAQHVGLLLGQEAFDDPGAGSHRIDVPAGDLDLGHARSLSQWRKRRRGWSLSSATAASSRKGPRSGGIGARANLAFVTQGDRGGKGNRGKPLAICHDPGSNTPQSLSAAMNSFRLLPVMI